MASERVRLRGVLAILCALTAPAEGEMPVISELHPAPAAGFAEFVELWNPSPEAIDLSGWRLSGGIDHYFAAGSRIEAFSFAVAAADPARFRSSYGFAPDGVYSGSLSGEGALTLTTREGAVACRAVWSLDPGSLALAGGASLELPSPDADGADPSSWEPSLVLGGTPRAESSRYTPRETDPVVPRRAAWRYWKGTAEPPGPALAWTGPDYDDGAWLSGPAPLGYGNFDDATVLEDMRSSYTTVYLRRAFTYRRPARLIDAVLWIVFDDGFVAYLNGTEIARRNLGERGTVPAHDAVAAARQEAEGVPEEIRLLDLSSLLREGRNVLAVQAANDHPRSSDFAIHPALTVASAAKPEAVVPAIVLNEAWAEGEKAFVELFHRGEQPVDLTGLRLLDGAGGGAIEIAPGATAPAGGFRAVEVPRVFLQAKVILVGADGRTLVDAARFLLPAEGGASGRFPDGDERLRLLPRLTPEAANAAPVPGSAVLTEIHYNPSDAEAEFVEVLAREALDLGGWSLAGGIRFRFAPGTRLEAGHRAVVARDPSRIPPPGSAALVLGPYRGHLSNDAEEVLLLDAEGRPVDQVRYADDGTWPAAADGEGPSLELADPSLENESGTAWRASLAPGGTPGLENSVSGAPSVPVVVFLRHEPVVPGPESPVRVTARIEPADSSVDLLWRTDGESDFRRALMEGSNGLHSAVIPPRAEGSIVEYAVEGKRGGALGGSARFPPGEPGTFLYQVDGRRDSPLLRTYRLILRARDLEALQADVSSNELRPAAFVGLGTAYQDARVRYRGHGSRLAEPKSYRVRFTGENPFEGATAILLNGFRPERQVLGMDLWRRAGMPYSKERIVQLAVNGQLFAHHAQVEPIDDAYLERHFGDAGGNLYRGLRTADFSYLGEASAQYEGLYEKRTNEEAHDWSDVIDLARAFSLSSDESFAAAISSRIDVAEWIRWLAVNAVLSNQEGGLHRDTGDDYFLYRPENGLFVLLPWDMDSTYLEPEERLFRPSLPAIRRLITHPRFAPLYYRELEGILSSYFTPAAVARQAALLDPAFPPEAADELVTFARQRAAFIRRSIPSRLSAGVAREGWGSGGDLHVLGPLAFLAGEAPAAGTASVTVGGLEAPYTAWTGAWAFDLPLPGLEARVRIAAWSGSGALLEAREAAVHRTGAGHVVSAIPAGRTEWLRGGSPYIVSSELEVPRGSELVLGEGVRVIASRGAALKVQGSLRAAGSSGSRIAFEAAGPGGSWQGIRLLEGSSGEISYADFLGDGFADDGFADDGAASPPRAAEPIILATGAVVKVLSSSFRGVARPCIEVVGGRAEVSDCRFLGTLEAIHGVRSTVIALRNLIDSVEGDSDGIDLDGDPPGDPAAAGPGGAAGAEPSRIEENTIIGGEDDGIDLLDSSAVVEGNWISGCADRGVSIEGAGSPRISWNVIHGCSNGLALKDGTAAAGDHNTITGCATGLHVFIKNPGSSGASGDFHSSIVWGNGRDFLVDSASRLALDHSDAGGDPARWGEGNIDADPLFAGSGDFRLLRGSPCTAAGREGTAAGALPVVKAAAPCIDSVEPRAGRAEGGDLIAIHGEGLEGFAEARIGGRLLENARQLASGAIVGETPRAARAGAAAVEVAAPAGRAVLGAGFGYLKRLLRGDANGDLKLDVSDAVAILRFLLAGGAPPACASVADATGDGAVRIGDAIQLLRYLFGLETGFGPAPAGFFVDCE